MTRYLHDVECDGDLPTVTIFHVPDRNGNPMRTGLELLTLIAPVFFSKHHPYLIRISPAQYEVTQGGASAVFPPCQAAGAPHCVTHVQTEAGRRWNAPGHGICPAQNGAMHGER